MNARRLMILLVVGILMGLLTVEVAAAACETGYRLCDGYYDCCRDTCTCKDKIYCICDGPEFSPATAAVAAAGIGAIAFLMRKKLSGRGKESA